MILTVPSRPVFTDVAQTAIEELARRVGVDETQLGQLSQAVADTFALLSERSAGEAVRLWLDADDQSVAVEAGPVFATSDGQHRPLESAAVSRFHEALADLVDVVAIDTGTAVIRFVKAAAASSRPGAAELDA